MKRGILIFVRHKVDSAYPGNALIEPERDVSPTLVFRARRLSKRIESQARGSKEGDLPQYINMCKHTYPNSFIQIHSHHTNRVWFIFNYNYVVPHLQYLFTKLFPTSTDSQLNQNLMIIYAYRSRGLTVYLLNKHGLERTSIQCKGDRGSSPIRAGV